MTREWSTHDLARAAGTTSRTLRHYDHQGLLPPSRIGSNGYRYYDEDALVRLQRILLLRELGLGLPQIADVLSRAEPAHHALEAHLELLRKEQERLARQISSVEQTIQRLEGGEELMAESMFDGFDHTRYRDEVERRWGADAYARSDAWWRGMDADARAHWQAATARLAREWVRLAESEADPEGEAAQRSAKEHVAWLAAIPGTPASEPDGDMAGYVRGLADMYVADPRFAATYATSAGGTAGAAFVREALHAYVDRT